MPGFGCGISEKNGRADGRLELRGKGRREGEGMEGGRAKGGLRKEGNKANRKRGWKQEREREREREGEGYGQAGFFLLSLLCV